MSNGSELLDTIVEFIGQHVALEPAPALALALWIMHTYLLDAFATTPRIAIQSATKRSGKSTLMTILKLLAYRAVFASNITASAVFRLIDAIRPTLLIDEVDTFVRENEQLRGVLNSGHNVHTAIVVLSVPMPSGGWEPKAYSTFAPVATAGIGRLNSTLEDRAIVISMRRKASTDRVVAILSSTKNEGRMLSRKIMRWSLDHITALESAEPMTPIDLDDRAADNWRPLLAIADAAGGAWSSLAQQASLSLSGPAVRDTLDIREMLLADLREIFTIANVDRVESKEICRRLREMEHRPWPEFRGKTITPPQLANLLRPFKIGPRTIRIKEKTAKGYIKTDFDDAFARHLRKLE